MPPKNLMTPPPAYSLHTHRGTFWILPGLDRLWHLIWDGEDLGGFASPEAAAAASPHVLLARTLNRDTLALPELLAGWICH